MLNEESHKKESKISKLLLGHSVEVAPKLLGMYLCRQTPEGLIKVRIVETEAYHQDDPASHSFKRKTERVAPMFQEGGTIYVYFTYGMHYCMNIVTGLAGRGEAVLLRAAEPVEGIEIMQKNRGITDINNLANGPAKLCKAFGINDTKLSGLKLSRLTLWLEAPGQTSENIVIEKGPRIGISAAIDEPLRFYIKGSPFVSRV